MVVMLVVSAALWSFKIETPSVTADLSPRFKVVMEIVDDFGLATLVDERNCLPS